MRNEKESEILLLMETSQQALWIFPITYILCKWHMLPIEAGT